MRDRTQHLQCKHREVRTFLLREEASSCTPRVCLFRSLIQGLTNEFGRLNFVTLFDRTPVCRRVPAAGTRCDVGRFSTILSYTSASFFSCYTTVAGCRRAAGNFVAGCVMRDDDGRLPGPALRLSSSSRFQLAFSGLRATT